jgi:hypothetical protein
LLVESRFFDWKDSQEQDYSSSWFRFPFIWEKQGIIAVRIVEKDFKLAYAPSFADGLTKPLFKKETLISMDDLTRVGINMKQIIESAAFPNNREMIKNAIFELLREEYSGLEEEKINNLTFGQIFGNIFWYCSRTHIFYDQKLWALSDPVMITNEMISSLVTELKFKEKDINHFMQDFTDYSFVSNNIRYFWIGLNRFL